MGKTTLLKAFKKASAQLLNFLLVISIVIPYGFFPKNVFAIATPSTNESNKTKGWAHVNVVSKDFNEITLEFVSTRTFSSCFEYRIDGDITQKTSDTNFNTEITDGLYPYYCQNNNTRKVKFTPNSYIEVRMVLAQKRMKDLIGQNLKFQVALKKSQG